jgi:hypothetical protein
MQRRFIVSETIRMLIKSVILREYSAYSVVVTFVINVNFVQVDDVLSKAMYMMSDV